MMIDSLKRQWAKIRSLKWMDSPGWMAQSAHVLLGICVVTFPVALGAMFFMRDGKTFDRWWIWALGFTVIDLAYMVHKEVTLDPLIEDEGFWPEGAKDILFNLIGLIVAWGSLYAAWKA